ncbi:MAG: hypothetical protein CMJ20_02635 [Phycisphaeraceae bacterium]|nr:hypothetical protein [Phycisphaeraceae bacterium]
MGSSTVMDTKVTIFTAVYNGLPHLPEAINSTLAQTYSDFIYLIIDDASTDDSLECILSYQDSRIKLVKNKTNLGTIGTINKALSLIDTPYAVRLDQDDVSLPSRVEDQLEYLETHPGISVVCSWEHTINSQGKRVRDWKRTIHDYGDFLGPVLLGLCPIWHPSLAFRTAAMNAIGGFKPDYARAEDFEVTTRFAIKRYGAAIVQNFHLLQREHERRQSIEFESEQVTVARRIHREALETFLDERAADTLGTFLRLEVDLVGISLTKKYLTLIHGHLNELIVKVTQLQHLSDNELASLSRVIYRRVGLGVRYAPILIRVPNVCFKLCFYILSPLHATVIKGVMSRVYHKCMNLKYIIKPQ